MNRIITSNHAESIHPQCISLCLLPFPTSKVLVKIIIPSLLQTSLSLKTRLESFRVISTLKITSLSLIPGLCRSLQFKDPSIIERTLEELHNQLESNRVSESIIDSLLIEKESACSLIVSELLGLIDNTNEDIRMLSIKVLMDFLDSLNTDEVNIANVVDIQFGKPILNKYIATDFEGRLLGDIRLLVRKLVTLILSEIEGNFKEFIHLCLKTIKEKRPLAIAHECVEAKRGGFLKRWEYLDTLLSIPN